MSRLFIAPYKMSSMSSKTLSRYFQTKRIYPDRKFKPKDGDIIINWGITKRLPVLEQSNADFRLINHPNAVAKATNKITTLNVFRRAGIPSPSFYLTMEEAENALFRGEKLFARTIVTGREGKGIIVVDSPDELPEAPLYTTYFKNDREFRVHVFNGEVIDYVEKKKMSKKRAQEMGIDISNRDGLVRNLKKGWSFCRKDISLPQVVSDVALDAIEALGMDFGAVDIVYDSETGVPVVLEINSAPGMKAGTTTHFNYVKAIAKLIGEEVNVAHYNEQFECDVLNAPDNDEPDEEEIQAAQDSVEEKQVEQEDFIPHKAPQPEPEPDKEEIPEKENTYEDVERAVEQAAEGSRVFSGRGLFAQVRRDYQMHTGERLDQELERMVQAEVQRPEGEVHLNSDPVEIVVANDRGYSFHGYTAEEIAEAFGRTWTRPGDIIFTDNEGREQE